MSGLEALPSVVVLRAEIGGILVIARPTRLPRRLWTLERELRRENAAGVEAPERDLRDEAPDLVR